MLSWIAERVTYANVVATLALFLAVGGVAYAELRPLLDKRGSVEARHIESNAVGRSEIAPKSVGLSELAPALRGELADSTIEGIYEGIDPVVGATWTFDLRGGAYATVTVEGLPASLKCGFTSLTDQEVRQTQGPNGVQLDIELDPGDGHAPPQGIDLKILAEHYTDTDRLEVGQASIGAAFAPACFKYQFSDIASWTLRPTD